MRYLIEKGRVVDFKCNKMATKIGVIIDFMTQSNFTIQIVCAKTGKALERVQMTNKHIILSEYVISFDDSEEIRGKAFERSVEESIKEAVNAKQQKESFKDAVRVEKIREMNDFERFMSEQEIAAKESLLRAKGF